MYGAYGQTGGQSSIYIYLIIAVVIALRIVRSRGVRPVNLVTIAITSALVLLSAYEIIQVSGSGAAGHFASPAAPPAQQGALAFSIVGLCLGLILGGLRGHATTIFRDATSGKVMQQASMYTYLFWVVLLLLRFGVRYLASAGLIGAWAGPASDVLLLIGTGSVLGRNAYVFWRYLQVSRVAGAMTT